MANRIKGITVEIGGDTTKVNVKYAHLPLCMPPKEPHLYGNLIALLPDKNRTPIGMQSGTTTTITVVKQDVRLREWAA